MDLTDRDLQDLRRLAKRRLRKARRALRNALPPGARAARSRAIVERVSELPELSKARSVALFWPMEDKGEVDLRELDAALRSRGASVYYPSSRGDAGTPVLCRAAAPEELAERGHGFSEPPPDAEVARPDEVDVIVVPALAVSEAGHRLGYGGGFYDALLARFRGHALSVVVAYDFDLLAELPVDAWDEPCDVVVTDRRTFRPKSP